MIAPLLMSALSGCKAGPGDAVAAVETRSVGVGVERFMAASIRLTDGASLDTRTAARLVGLMAQLDETWTLKIARLAQLAATAQGADALLEAARAEGLDEVAHAVVAAWFTGTVGQGPSAHMVAYADALMYRPVADALAPPTYSLGGPAWWTQPLPPVGVSRPVARPAPPPATVGVPEAKSR